MENENAITTTPQEDKPMARITNYLESEIVQHRFSEILGERGAKQYVASVLIAAAESKQLQTCAPESIYISALRAATLRLSVDPSTGQAYLVPFGNRATLVVGYKGLYDMAIRTNKYRYINVARVYENEEVIEDRITGLHRIESKTGFKRSVSSWDNSESNGYATIGWIGAFEMMNGFKHTFYMTVDEIHAHAKQYSKGYDYKDKNGEFTSLWHKEPAKMERKTVLRLMLRRWAPLDPTDTAMLNIIDDEGGEIDVVDEIPMSTESVLSDPSRSDDAPEIIQPTEKKTEQQNMKELGFES